MQHFFWGVVLGPRVNQDGGENDEISRGPLRLFLSGARSRGHEPQLTAPPAQLSQGSLA